MGKFLTLACGNPREVNVVLHVSTQQIERGFSGRRSTLGGSMRTFEAILSLKLAKYKYKLIIARALKLTFTQLTV